MADQEADNWLSKIETSKKGRLKIYIGMSAGVGKTFRMLQEAHNLLRNGVNLKVGYVETHGRKETQALIARRKDEQLGKKRQKDDALKNQTVQAKDLEVQKKEKDVVLNQLKSQEKDLQKQLTAKKKKDRE